MTSPRELTPITRTPEEIIREGNHVYAGCFPLRPEGRSSYEDAGLKREVYKELRGKKIKDPTTITPCDSIEERIEGIIKLLQYQSMKPGYDKKPWVIVANNDDPHLKDSLAELIGKNPEFYGRILTRQITIIEKNAPIHDPRENSDMVISGIHITNLVFKRRI